MTEAVLTTTTNAVFIPTIIAQKCIQKLSAYLSVGRNVSKDADWATASFGQTIQVPKTGAVSANDKTQGSNYTKQAPTGTNAEVVLNKHKEVTVTIDDVTKVLDNQDTQMRYAEDGAIALAEAIETDLLDLHPSVENTVTWDDTSATTIDTSMLNVRKYFADQKVPKLEPKFMAVDPTVYNEVLTVEKFVNNSWRGQSNSISEGMVVKTYGIEIEENQLIPVSCSPVAYHNLAYTRNGLILATRPLPAPEASAVRYARVMDSGAGIALRTLFWYNADLGAHQLTLDVLYGVAILDQRRVVEIESD